MDKGVDTVDSDVNSIGQTGIFSLALEKDRTNIDAGVVLIGGSVGDYVWDDANTNGVQDSEELGFAGITVRLYTSSGSLVVTTSTNEDGYYSFTSVTPGSYYIVVEAPPGYRFTGKDVGADDALDSDVNSSGQTDVFSLSLGQVRTNLDAGVVSLDFALVGNFVWDDYNGNGVQDPGEPGLADVTVFLLDDKRNRVGVTSTDANGSYVFTSLTPGTYSVEIVLPPGYVPTAQDAGGNDALDSDVDRVTRTTEPFVLTAGQYDSSRDAGLFLSDLPEVLRLSPSFGPTTGGTSVVITGHNLSNVNTVLFGTAGAMLRIDSDTQITATAPAQFKGFVDVTAVSPSGTSAVTPEGRFEYVAAPIRTDPSWVLYCLDPASDTFLGPIPLGFTVNFFGRTFTHVFVNDNGNITFGSAFSGNSTPSPLSAALLPIIAAFWGDVDTRFGPLVCYAYGFVDGRLTVQRYGFLVNDLPICTLPPRQTGRVL